MTSLKIVKTEDIDVFIERMKHYEYDDIECTKHTFFRLNERQRKVFNCGNIKEFIKEHTPKLVGIQNNGNYSIFYNYGRSKYIRIIISIKINIIRVVTFYIIDKDDMPRMK